MSRTPEKEEGLTLIELMIVIAIIGIIAAVAVPQFGAYAKRAKFTEVISASVQAKTALSTCLQSRGASRCTSWDDIGVDPIALAAPDSIASATIQAAPLRMVFTASPELNGVTYEISPTYDPGTTTLTWTVSGTCLNASTRYC